ncbi:uncharacterized protein LOC124939189 [Impatiens glandulifera]|uniref:uncharacterized protein LOC124939189 n=1 Tax=Impatiens glandulifera TaxID=253017 RepID=UPI001FB16FD5|nr:uncharacterized protein LOC124939189 [Impatiens glandulifera]
MSLSGYVAHKLSKNKPGNRSDIGWEYGIDVDSNSKKVKCKLCSKIFSGGIYRFKHHLSCTHKDAEPCISVPDDVKLKTVDKIFQMLDAIVEEVGEENVVQIVSDNAANYKLVGELLMEKRKRLYWTPCAAHCIDLMLEDFEKKIHVHTLTIQSAKSITSSRNWKSSSFSSTVDGKKIEAMVIGSRLWSNIITCLKAARPLIKVLRMVDSDVKPAMGFIYEQMDEAKEKIRVNFNNIKRNCDFKSNFQIKKGLYSCIERMITDENMISKIDSQLESFKNARGLFGSKFAKMAISTKSPAEWWDSYGDECPELQMFAIRILSLTCSSSGCERNWSAFEMVHTKRRNYLHQQKMNDLVFVMYNMKLNDTQVLRKYVEDVSSDDEWITKENDAYNSSSSQTRLFIDSTESRENEEEICEEDGEKEGVERDDDDEVDDYVEVDDAMDDLDNFDVNNETNVDDLIS